MAYIPSSSELIDASVIYEAAGLRAGMKAADLGCGTSGHFVFPGARILGEAGEFYAVDILKSALSAVESRAKLEQLTNIKTVWADIEVLNAVKILSGSLDLVLLANNQPNPAMVQEAARLVRGGGKLVVVDWKVGATPFGPPTAQRKDATHVRAMVEGAGLRLEKEFSPGKYHWGMVFIK